MRRLLAVTLLSLVFVPAALVLQPTEASACSCMPSAGAVPAAQQADVVFQAKLVRVADAPPGGDMPSKLFTFEVVRMFKGQIDAEVIVSTADNSAACGREYGDVGSEWLVYASASETGQLHDNLCSRTMSFADAAADVAELETHADELDDEPKPEGEPGPVEDEPEPIEPSSSGGPVTSGEEPEPTTSGNRCSVVDESPAGGLLGMLAFGLGLAVVRRRRD